MPVRHIALSQRERLAVFVHATFASCIPCGDIQLITRTPNTFCAHPERTQGRHYWALLLGYISLKAITVSTHPPQRTMGPTITQDVWLHIATFLSKEEIWCLRFLNHSFLRLALANRFSTLRILSSLTQDWTHLCKFR